MWHPALRDKHTGFLYAYHISLHPALPLNLNCARFNTHSCPYTHKIIHTYILFTSAYAEVPSLSLSYVRRVRSGILFWLKAASQIESGHRCPSAVTGKNILNQAEQLWPVFLCVWEHFTEYKVSVVLSHSPLSPSNADLWWPVGNLSYFLQHCSSVCDAFVVWRASRSACLGLENIKMPSHIHRWLFLCMFG